VSRIFPEDPEDPVGTPEVDDATVRRRAEIGGDGLRSRVARGTVFNTLFLVGINALTLVQGLVVAGLLGADEYGVWGLLAISFGTLFALGAIGIGDKYIQQDHPDQRVAFEIAFTLGAMLCGLFMVIALIAIPLFSLLYDEPRMLLPGLLLATAFPLLALQTPIWVFNRRMDFGKQRALQSVQPVVTFIVTLPLALAGLGFWSLVIGALAGSVVATVVVVLYSPYKLRFRYERGSIREYATFSWPLLVSSVSIVLAFQVTITVAARSVGPAAVGAIALASQITQYTRRVDQIITSALYPAICVVKDQRDLLFEAFTKSNRLALLWGFPVGVAIVLFAPQAVPMVLGEKWEFAVSLIQVLGLSAALNMIGFNWTAFARARGETKILAVATVLATIAMIGVGVPLLLSEGLHGFAMGMLAGTLTTLVVRLVYLIRLFPARGIAEHVARSFVPVLPAATAILLERALFGSGESVTRLVLETTGYLLLVGVTTWFTERQLLREAVAQVLGQRPRFGDTESEPAPRLA
jgi:O-antigen/teichoic acid export membrane protein